MYLLLDLNILGMLQIGNTSSTFSLSLFRGHFFNSIYFTYDSVMFAFFSNPMYVLSWLCSDLFFIREQGCRSIKCWLFGMRSGFDEHSCSLLQLTNLKQHDLFSLQLLRCYFIITFVLQTRIQLSYAFRISLTRQQKYIMQVNYIGNYDNSSFNSYTLPLLPERSTCNRDQFMQQSQQFKQKISNLEGHLRILKKKYKQNIKDGFENKIKSFRLQAVIQRKIIQANIDDTKKQIQHAQYQQKSKRAKSQKQAQASMQFSISEKINDKIKRARSKIDRDKQIIKMKIKQQQYELSLQHKQAHDKAKGALQFSDMKKKYFEHVRKRQFSRQKERQKSMCIQKILQNRQTLNKLQKQLTEMSKSKILNMDTKSNTFLTI